jgi:hypothetical protein
MEANSIETNSYILDPRSVKNLVFAAALPRISMIWTVASTVTVVFYLLGNSPMLLIIGPPIFYAVLILVTIFLRNQYFVSPKRSPSLFRQRKSLFTGELFRSEDSEGTVYSVPIKDLTRARVIRDYLLMDAIGGQLALLVPLSAFKSDQDREGVLTLLRKFNLLRS